VAQKGKKREVQVQRKGKFSEKGSKLEEELEGKLMGARKPP